METTNTLQPFNSIQGFSNNYNTWIDPSNGYVSQFTNAPYSPSEPGMRVIFAAGLYEGTAQTPTVSEGMGYGLLLAYAANDQKSFDAFLRYVVNETAQGCSTFYQGQCQVITKHLMPWLVNDAGSPVTLNGNSTAGSASDADVQIAYAVYLASQRWPGDTVDGQTYTEIFNNMLLETEFFDFYQSQGKWFYTPGSAWGSTGLAVLYPGYLTPQALSAFPTGSNPATPPPSIGNSTNTHKFTVKVKNTTAVQAHYDYIGGGNLTFSPTPSGSMQNGYTSNPFTVTSTNGLQNGSNFTIKLNQYPVEYNTFLQKALGVESGNYPGVNIQFTWEENAWNYKFQPNPPFGSQGWTRVATNGTNVAVSLVWPPTTIPGFDSVTTDVNNLATSFQTTNKADLVPNVLQLDGNYTLGANNDGFTVTTWSNSFSYDAVRYPFWVGSNALATGDAVPTPVQNIINFMKKSAPEGFMPSNGFYALNGNPVCDSGSTATFILSPALIAPLVLPASAMKDQYATTLTNLLDTYNILFDIPSKAPTQSNAYFNTILFLISQASLVGNGSFDLGTAIPAPQPLPPPPSSYPTQTGITPCQPN